MRAMVFVQTRLRAKCLAAEVALERFLSSMCSKVHVEIGFLGKSMIADLAHKRTLISVNGFDVHLQAVAAGGPMAALLTHKQFLTTMFGCLV